MAETQRSEPDADRRQRKKDRKRAARAVRQATDASSPPAPPLIAFVHIPKTAGGTLKSVFADTLGREAVHNAGNYLRNPERTAAQTARAKPGVRVTIGHVPYGLLRAKLPSDTRYITFLREPVERVLSHYHRHLASDMVTLPDLLDRGEPAVSNLMTRFLCGREHPHLLGALPDEAVDEAKRILESFAFVGFQDRFDESLVRLGEQLDIQMSAYGVSMHVNPNRPQLEEVEEKDLALVRRHNQLDTALFEWALERFVTDDDVSDAVRELRDAVTTRGEAQHARTARAVEWLTQHVPPGTARLFQEVREEAGKVGIAPLDIYVARRQMNPRGHKMKTERGVMLVFPSDEAQRATKPVESPS